jgi:hypothetical protein
MSAPRIAGSGCGYWPTATADDANNVTRDSGQFQSPTRVARGTSTRQTWATPSKACADGGQTSRGGDRKDELLLAGQAGGSLNPDWVSWLMGWPVGWEDASRELQWECQSASTDCDHLVTVRCLSRWQQLSSSWLAGLGY